MNALEIARRALANARRQAIAQGRARALADAALRGQPPDPVHRRRRRHRRGRGDPPRPRRPGDHESHRPRRTAPLRPAGRARRPRWPRQPGRATIPIFSRRVRRGPRGGLRRRDCAPRPGTGRPALAAAFAVGAAIRARGARDWTVGRARARGGRRRRRAATERTTDAYMKVICIDPDGAPQRVRGARRTRLRRRARRACAGRARRGARPSWTASRWSCSRGVPGRDGAARGR